jgi:hypothetical protein
MQALSTEHSLKRLWVNSVITGQLPILDGCSMIEEAAGTTITNALPSSEFYFITPITIIIETLQLSTLKGGTQTPLEG